MVKSLTDWIEQKNKIKQLRDQILSLIPKEKRNIEEINLHLSALSFSPEEYIEYLEEYLADLKNDSGNQK